MTEKNGRYFVLASGSKQFFECPRLDITGAVSIDHLFEQKLYSRKNKKCRECGVCEAFLMKIPVLKQDVIANMSSQKKIRPHGWRATHKKMIKRASSGIGG